MLSLLAGAVLYVQEPKPFLEANLPHYTEELVAKDPFNYEVASSAPTSTKEDIEGLIQEIFGRHAKTALKIFTCESNLVATATLKTKREDSRGIAQINTFAHKSADPEKLYEPRYNLEYAKTLFDKESWKPWTCAKQVRS